MADGGVRLAELLTSLSLAIDLGLGLPMEWMQRSALVAVRLAQAAGLNVDDQRAAYYLAMLRNVGCTTTSDADARLLGDELGAAELIVTDPADGRAMVTALRRTIAPGRNPLVRTAMIGRLIAHGATGGMANGHRQHCEAGAIIAGRMGLGPVASEGIWHTYERWDGKGTPAGIGGEALSLPMRIIHVASLAAHFHREAGVAEAVAAVVRRSGKQLDPRLVAVFAADAATILGEADPDTAAVLAAEPGEPLTVAGDALDTALGAVADFGDFKSPHMLGHSRRVAALADNAARAASVPAADLTLIRRAGLVHDLGRVGVQAAIWTKAGALSPGERERVRLHTYLTERVFANSPALQPIGALGALHHERLDGSGYHRGLAAPMLPAAARLLAAANAWCALTEPRPHRPTLSPTEAASALASEARAGRLDARAVDAVLTAAEQKPPHTRRAASISLSEREIEVLALVARQRTNKQIARALDISPKTVERHVTHVYDKLGVTTRAGAALYATANGLL